MINRLLRDADQVIPHLRELPSGELMTTKTCRIQIPKRFTQRGLAEIGMDTYIVGLYPLIMDNYYAVSNVNSMVKINPHRVTNITIGGVPYMEFAFLENQVLITNINLVKRDTLIYNIIDELVFKGNIPWYVGYDDLGKLFDTAGEYAGSGVGSNYEVIELMASILARNPRDRTQYYRMILDSEKDKAINPSYVAMSSVYYAATNTLNKLAGSYFSDGVVSALVSPTTQVEKIEQLLRA